MDNDRIRREASRNLVDAALATGAARYVQESITFLYAAAGDTWIDEDESIQVPAYTRSTLEAEAQARRFTESGGIGVVLRFGLFYGPDSHHTVDTVRLARRRVAATFGRSDAYLSSINTDDAARGSSGRARTRRRASTTWWTTSRSLVESTSRPLALRWASPGRGSLRRRWPSSAARRPRHSPGRSACSNERFKKETGWSPAYPSAREGWPAVVAEMTSQQEPADA